MIRRQFLKLTSLIPFLGSVPKKSFEDSIDEQLLWVEKLEKHKPFNKMIHVNTKGYKYLLKHSSEITYNSAVHCAFYKNISLVEDSVMVDDKPRSYVWFIE